MRLLFWHIKVNAQRKEILWAFGVLLLISIISLLTGITDCMNASTDRIEYLPAYTRTVIHTSVSMSIINGFFFCYLLPLIAPFSGGDVYYCDRINGVLPLILTKISHRKYVLTQFLAVYLVGSCMVIIVLVINLLWCALAFPMDTVRDFTSNPSWADTYNGLLDYMFFPDTYSKNPYLYLMIYFAIIGNFAGLCTALSYTISLYIKRYRAVILGFSFVFFNMVMVVSNGLYSLGLIEKRIQVQQYLIAADDTEKYSLWLPILFYLSCITICLVVVLRKTTKSQDVF